MNERRTQSYAAVPRKVHDDIAEQVRTGVFARVHHVETDPDFEPELPPSPTFWPREEPKEPQR